MALDMKTMKKLSVIAIAAASILSGCPPPTGAASSVKFTNEASVADCQYLGAVDGNSGWGG